ncbi:MAG: hypothetical protein IJI05_02195, partial [Erysipelotrichaceae bacterium]|nr:hypothetical protein [Erysipelotrichaceae bacterium]
FRAEYLARNIGYQNVSSLGSNGLIILMPHWYVREFFAFIKEVVVCTLNRGAFALRLMEVAG